MAICPPEKLIVLVIPANGSLGESEKDFGNVTVRAINLDGTVIDEVPKLCIVPSGKLGTLKGGFQFIDDFREPLSKEDVRNMALQSTKDKLNRKRTGVSTNNWMGIRMYSG